MTRLAKKSSPEYQVVLVEYLDYLKFLVYRHRDYEENAVLRFDEEFRELANFKKFSLSDSSQRGSLSDKYFHAKSQKFEQPNGSSKVDTKKTVLS